MFHVEQHKTPGERPAVLDLHSGALVPHSAWSFTFPTIYPLSTHSAIHREFALNSQVTHSESTSYLQLQCGKMDYASIS